MRPSTAHVGRQNRNSEASRRAVGCSLREFRIKGEIGKGAYGVVYEVESLKDHNEYVLKKIPIKHLKRHEIQDVITEAKILRKLDHKHIVKSYSHFVENGALHIIMEYARGGDLQKFIKAKKAKGVKIKEEEIWRIGYQLAMALSYLHEHNIIHRDIKTLNVFLDEDNNVKVGDMGVSKIVNSALSVQNTRVGTPLYLAPELVKQNPYNFKVDIWAMGCVLFHLCAKCAPFDGKGIYKLGYNIVKKSPKSLPESYSRELRTFIKKLLEKKAAKRPSSKELVTILNEKRLRGVFTSDTTNKKVEKSEDMSSQDMLKRIKSEGPLRKKNSGKKSLLMNPDTKRVKVQGNINTVLMKRKNKLLQKGKEKSASKRQEKSEQKNNYYLNKNAKVDIDGEREKSLEVASFRSEDHKKIDFRKNKYSVLQNKGNLASEVIEEKSIEISKPSQSRIHEEERMRVRSPRGNLKRSGAKKPKINSISTVSNLPGKIKQELNDISQRVSHIENDFMKKSKSKAYLEGPQVHRGRSKSRKTMPRRIRKREIKVRKAIPAKKSKLCQLAKDKKIRPYSRQMSLKDKIKQMERNLKKNHSFYRSKNRPRPQTAAPIIKSSKVNTNIIPFENKNPKENCGTQKTSSEKDKRRTQNSTFVGTKTHFQGYNEKEEGRKPRPKTAAVLKRNLRGGISHPFLNPFQSVFKSPNTTQKAPKSLINVWGNDSNRTLISSKEKTKDYQRRNNRPQTAGVAKLTNKSQDEDSPGNKKGRYRIKTAYAGNKVKRRPSSNSGSVIKGNFLDRKPVSKKLTIHDLS